MPATTMSLIRCPICDRKFESNLSPAMPFCSERCRDVDLGRWLDESYSVPVEPDPDAFEEEQQHEDTDY